MDRPAKSGSVKLDDDGDSTMDSGDESDTTTTGDKDSKPTTSTSTPSKKIQGGNQKGSPVAPTFTSIGSPQVATHQELQRGASNSGLRKRTTSDSSAQEQLRKTPEGDQASAAVKAEGLMDTSEDPLKM